MRIISTLFCCALLFGFNSCLEEVGFDSIENAVDVADCDLYGVMNDSLWCGTASLALINNDTISIRFNKNGSLVNGYAAEAISFKIVFIVDKGTYFLENGDLSILQQTGSDTFVKLYDLDTDNEDTGEVTITKFDGDTREVFGTIRFNINNANRTPINRRFTGGRFNVVLNQ